MDHRFFNGCFNHYPSLNPCEILVATLRCCALFKARVGKKIESGIPKSMLMQTSTVACLSFVSTSAPPPPPPPLFPRGTLPLTLVLSLSPITAVCLFFLCFSFFFFFYYPHTQSYRNRCCAGIVCSSVFSRGEAKKKRNPFLDGSVIESNISTFSKKKIIHFLH